jgi:tetratricopeptide (TPR) repeat protein
MNYGYDGGQELLDHLEEYFDTPEHAAFAIQMATNPHLDRPYVRDERWKPRAAEEPSYDRVNTLLEKHSALLKSNRGADALALLGMRTALRMGDPPAALRVAAMIPDDAAIRAEPDFNWMLASAHFLSHEYEAAEEPLLTLFKSSRSTNNQKAAAAYALCGVYQKNKNAVEQIHFALWLHDAGREHMYFGNPSGVGDQSVYWAVSGWDLNLLLDAEATIDSLGSFLRLYPDVPDVRLVRYSLAVRLARENRYEEAAEIYQRINAGRRAARMRQLAALYKAANGTEQAQEAKYKMAKFIADNPDRIYFNDALWGGYQRYALVGSGDSRLTREERRMLMENERRLKDDQEERWRAYMILREVVQDSGKTQLGRHAARLAVVCLRGISERFERQDEIHKADTELSNWLRGS